MKISETYKIAAETLKNSDCLLITAGAGIGVDSGLPDFRGNDGFWKAYPPIAKLGISFVEMANPKWFESKPQFAWAFYGHRLNLYRKTIPHKGFAQLKEISEKLNFGSFIFTSNVDGQFHKAGFDENKIEEVHGSIHYFQCSIPCSSDIWISPNAPVLVNEETFEANELLPKCPKCGKIARPNILMFGDWTWQPHRSNEQGKKLNSWLGRIKKEKLRLTIIELGAGKEIATVRHKTQSVARELNAKIIRINPRDYDLPSGNHIPIPTGAAEGINGIFQEFIK